MQNTTQKRGLSGEFHIIDGELQPSPYEIVNIIGKGQRSVGFWTEKDGILYKLKNNGKTAKNINEQLGARPSFVQEYDAVVGDVTILASRSKYVDFTLPFSESGISVVVPVRDDDRKNMWIFLKPLERKLWITAVASFICIGFFAWVFEHSKNPEFREPTHEQVGITFWFSFSTLVFAQSLGTPPPQELAFGVCVRSKTNFNRYQEGSFDKEILKRMHFDSSKFRSYNTLEEYNDALSRGSKNGGVGAIVDELPYLRLFLNKYCRKYTMVGPSYRAAGFGFAFPKGSPLVPDVSKAVLQVMEGEFMNNVLQKWVGNGTDCPRRDIMAMTSESLKLDSFIGLFIIAGASIVFGFLIFILLFLYRCREILATDQPILQKLSALAEVFNGRAAPLAENGPPHEELPDLPLQNAAPLAENEHPLEELPDLAPQIHEIAEPEPPVHEINEG
ncbi:putative glutamate receptor 2.8-like [Capsicum annuum]|nr:putative glutamate receptor 2.8-like [Capsicum annuum]KAF3672527.1 putative glutamate receptor 2.8-like [Capsicum annuum]